MGIGTKINEAFKPLYTSDKRYFIITGGRGSLKSTSVHDFICRLTYSQNHGILFTRYTMASAEKSIIPEFLLVAKRNNSILDFDVTRNKIVNKKTGSFILFSGIKTSSGDQTANLKIYSWYNHLGN
jgi:phage terminase large subunit